MSSPIRIALDQSVPWYSLQATLDLVTYTLEFAFNSRGGYWVMNVNDINDNPILSGVKLMVRRNLTAPYHTLALPPGDFVVVDDLGDGSEAGLGSFLLDHTLFYVSPN